MRSGATLASKGVEMNVEQTMIERMYQEAINLRDSTWQAINFEPIEEEYRRQYQRAFRSTHDVATFRRQTREYRALLRAFNKQSLVEAAASPSAEPAKEKSSDR